MSYRYTVYSKYCINCVTCNGPVQIVKPLSPTIEQSLGGRGVWGRRQRVRNKYYISPRRALLCSTLFFSSPMDAKKYCNTNNHCGLPSTISCPQRDTVDDRRRGKRVMRSMMARLARDFEKRITLTCDNKIRSAQRVHKIQ